jgi:bacterial leucyl aminopeptidase
MKLSLAISFCSVAGAAVALPQQQQLTFLQSSPPSLLSLTPDLASRLSSLPSAHASQLAQHISALPQRRLVQFEQDGEILEVTEGEKALLVFQGIKFRDVTDDQAVPVQVQSKGSSLCYIIDTRLLPSLTLSTTATYPTKFSHSASSLNSTFAHLSIDEMKTFLGQFSGFYTRYYRSPQGKESQQFLLKHLTEVRFGFRFHSVRGSSLM